MMKSKFKVSQNKTKIKDLSLKLGTRVHKMLTIKSLSKSKESNLNLNRMASRYSSLEKQGMLSKTSTLHTDLESINSIQEASTLAYFSNNSRSRNELPQHETSFNLKSL